MLILIRFDVENKVTNKKLNVLLYLYNKIVLFCYEVKNKIELKNISI